MKKYILVLFGLFLVSCDKNKVHDSFERDFILNRWITNEEQTFEFSIPEDGVYDIDLHFGHVYDFQFATIPLELTFLNEEKIINQKAIDLVIKNDIGEDLADCTGDICDLYQNIEKELTIKKGTYIIKVKNKFPASYLPNILGLGIRVTKTVLK
jgi:gliding motility-associated lipoprotein GldH